MEWRGERERDGKREGGREGGRKRDEREGGNKRGRERGSGGRDGRGMKGDGSGEMFRYQVSSNHYVMWGTVSHMLFTVAPTKLEEGSDGKSGRRSKTGRTSHLAEPFQTCLPVRGEDRVLCQALPHTQSVRYPQPEVAVAKHEPDEVHSVLHLSKMIVPIINTVCLRVNRIVT